MPPSQRTKDRTTCPSDTNLIKALSNPVRASVLTILNQRVASPKAIANELGEEIGRVAYHIKVLREYGCVELVKTEPRRGATEHFYRGILRPYLDDSFWSKLSPDVRNGISVTGLRVLNKAVEEAMKAQTFDSRTDRHLSCVSFDLDEQAWGEANSVLNEALDRLSAISSESDARKRKKKVRGTFGLMGFESPWSGGAQEDVRT